MDRKAKTLDASLVPRLSPARVSRVLPRETPGDESGEPIRTLSKYMKPATSAGKRVRVRHR